MFATALCRKPWNTEYCYFFCKWNQYGKGARCDRKTKNGYWKKTGKELDIIDSDTGERIGIRSILVFYEGRNPGKKTKHIMHIYELKDHISRLQVCVCFLFRLLVSSFFHDLFWFPNLCRARRMSFAGWR